MLVEIFKDEQVRLIAVQYPSSDSQTESMMRVNYALFDTPFLGMSEIMIERIKRSDYRTGIFILQDD